MKSEAKHEHPHSSHEPHVHGTEENVGGGDKHHHQPQHEKKEESSVGQKRRIPEQILEAIQEIFGRSSISITLKDAMKS